MVYFNLVQGIGRNVLRRLLQVTDAAGVLMQLDHCLQSLRGQGTLLSSMPIRFSTFGRAYFEKITFFSSAV